MNALYHFQEEKRFHQCKESASKEKNANSLKDLVEGYILREKIKISKVVILAKQLLLRLFKHVLPDVINQKNVNRLHGLTMFQE